MRSRRIALAVVLLVLAVVAVLLAADLRSWRATRPRTATPSSRSTRRGELARVDRASVRPARSDLSASTSQLAFRRAERRFVAVAAAGNGFDNGYSESRARGALEADADEPRARGRSPRRDVRRRQPARDPRVPRLAPERPERARRRSSAAVADFQAAVQLDPTNEDAKFNLELLLRELLARGRAARLEQRQRRTVQGAQGRGRRPARGGGTDARLPDASAAIVAIVVARAARGARARRAARPRRPRRAAPRRAAAPEALPQVLALVASPRCSRSPRRSRRSARARPHACAPTRRRSSCSTSRARWRPRRPDGADAARARTARRDRDPQRHARHPVRRRDADRPRPAVPPS